VIAACEKAVGRTIPYQIVDPRPGDPGILVTSPAKAIKELGWNLAYSSIETIVNSAWRWHSGHPAGYGRRA
jgi:UDP-glucose 4-epimerase